MIPFPHVQEQAAGHTAAIQRHGKPHRRHLVGAHGHAQREQHAELGLHRVKAFHPAHGILPGHGKVLAQWQRGPPDVGKLFQQGLLHLLGLRFPAAQHQQLDAGGAEHLTVSLGQRLRGQAVHLFQVALLPDAGGAAPKELPVGLPLAVDALFVDLILQRLFQHLLFDGDRLRVKHTAHKIGMERRAQRQRGILPGQGLALQCKAVLDAGHTDAEVVVCAQRAGIHGQVRAVQPGKLFGHLGHIRAIRIAPLHQQGQQSVGGCRLPPCRKRKVDADPAAVEFLRRVPGKMDPGRDLGSSQQSFSFFVTALCAPAQGTPPARVRTRGWRGHFPPPHSASARARIPCRWRPAAPPASGG